MKHIINLEVTVSQYVVLELIFYNGNRNRRPIIMTQSNLVDENPMKMVSHMYCNIDHTNLLCPKG